MVMYSINNKAPQTVPYYLSFAEAKQSNCYGIALLYTYMQIWTMITEWNLTIGDWSYLESQIGPDTNFKVVLIMRFHCTSADHTEWYRQHSLLSKIPLLP